MSEESTTNKALWKLKRYGRFLPKAKNVGGSSSWKVFESSESKGTLELTILESGHLLVSQAQELLEGFSLLNAQSFLKIQQKSDSLLFYFTLKEESRMIRVQFEGSSRSEAVDLCRKAVERLNEYLPVGTQEQPGPSSATHTAGISIQQQQTPVAAPQEIRDVTQESLSIKQLSQYFLGESGLSMPLAYHHFTLPPGDTEALLRLCLLDSGFPSFVEEVENKLKALIQE
ncbi:meiotic recombination protein REC114 [Tachysurus fulvidraco]|uniref:meiotic recombination protein REC114 n=1 Tax=Tachysurus fulvidraco TaxID=1234273 RepID=UPI000F4E6A14|nr:meiotic recombination protein REC114 [Tachysurus fulvidraco]XP_027015172.1 meiotic recombination protein REC114 [Tachysurus fulvidraco]XP_027015173.1 meiotic recombination protein REC114 [Tachysurus fulvidraco]XP_027015174.1 meiotic recombination protein REC114 [Tachysurus fulvidraco]